MTEQQNQTASVTVFYDGSCPICSREIGYYQNRDRGGDVNWVNLEQVEPGGFPDGLDKPTAMRRFHAVDERGNLVSGGAAFAAMWRQINGFRWLGSVVRLKPFTMLFDLMYVIFLKVRPFLQKVF